MFNKQTKYLENEPWRRIFLDDVNGKPQYK